MVCSNEGTQEECETVPLGSRNTASRNTGSSQAAELSRRIEALIDAAEGKQLTRLVREDLVGRVAVIATTVLLWFALALLDPRIALLAIAGGAVTALRLRRLPPPTDADPDDWL
jgi:hypothetical protein